MLAHLRRNGVNSLRDIRYVLYESRDEHTIVPERGPQVPDPDLVRIALRETAAYPRRTSDGAAPPTRSAT